MSTPTDGEWMSAKEALDCLGLGFANGAHAICGFAFAGLVQAKARRFLVEGTPADDDVELPREFWSRSEEATWHDWRTGHFKTTFDDRRFFEAFGVQFRRSDIERLKAASATDARPPFSRFLDPTPSGAVLLSPTASASSHVEPTSPIEPLASRKVFIVHGRDENAKNEVALFLKKIGLEDIVLHQRPNRGRNLLSKFQEEAEGSSFAVILMTPDDDGGLAGGPQQKRARQMWSLNSASSSGSLALRMLRLSLFPAWKSHPISTEYAG